MYNETVLTELSGRGRNWLLENNQPEVSRWYNANSHKWRWDDHTYRSGYTGESRNQSKQIRILGSK